MRLAALILGVLALAAAAAAACACAAAEPVVAFNGTVVVAGAPGALQGCDCTRAVQYSLGPTTARVSVDALDLDGSATACTDSLAVYASADFADPEALLLDLCEAVQLTFAVTSGSFVLRFRTGPDSLSTGYEVSFVAVNGEPVFSVPASTVPAEFGAETPAGATLVDWDNYDAGIRLSVDCDPLVAVDLPGIGLVQEDEFTLTHDEASTLVADMNVIPLAVTEEMYTVRLSADDLGGSGIGGPQTASAQITVAPQCAVAMQVGPENGSITDGPLPYEVNMICSFTITNVFRLQFELVDIEPRDLDDREAPCFDYVQVLEGTEEPISNEISDEGFVCGLANEYLPTIESTTGTLFVVFQADFDIVGEGFVANIIGRPDSFVVEVSESIPDVIEVAYGSNFDFPVITVFNVPDRDLTVTVEVENGSLRLSRPFDSVTSVALDSVVVFQTEDADFPARVINEAIRSLIYTSDVLYRGPDTITIECSTSSGQSTRLTIDLLVVGVRVRLETLFLSSGALSPLALPLSIAGHSQPQFLYEVVVAAAEGVLSTDLRSYNGTLFFQGDLASVNTRLSTLVHVMDVPGLDVVTVSVSDGVTSDAAEASIPVSAQCSGHRIITDLSGSFTDRVGDRDDLYDVDADCRWTILGSRTLVFDFFDLELGFDLLSIWEGEDETGNLIGTFSGTLPRITLESNILSFHLHFTTDFFVNARGFVISYQPAVVNVPPFVLVPGAPIPILRNTTGALPGIEIVDLDALPTDATRIQFSTDAGALSFDAAVSGVDGIVVEEDTASLLRATVSNFAIDEFVELVRFSAPDVTTLITVDLVAQDAQDSEVTRFQVQTVNCAGVANITTASPLATLMLTDGSGSDVYAPNLDCGWVLSGAEAPAQLEFESIELQLDGGLCIDSLTVYDGVSRDPNRLIGEYCTLSQALQSPILSYSGSFFIHFASDDGTESEGFLVAYGAVPSDEWKQLDTSIANDLPAELGRQYHGAITLGPDGEFMLVAAGSDQFETLMSPILYSFSARAWTSVAVASESVPSPRWRAALVATGPYTAFLYGGQERSVVTEPQAPFRDAWLLHVVVTEGSDALVVSASANWTQLSPASDKHPPGLVGPTAAVLDGTVYLFGGSTADGSTVNELWSFPLSGAGQTTAEWTLVTVQGEAAPAPRFLHNMVALPTEGMLAVLMGLSSADPDQADQLSDLWGFWPATQTWTALHAGLSASLSSSSSSSSSFGARQGDDDLQGLASPTARDSAGVTVLDGEIVLSAGVSRLDSSVLIELADTWAFNVTDGFWVLIDRSGDTNYGAPIVVGSVEGRRSIVAYSGVRSSTINLSTFALTLTLSVSRTVPDIAAASGGTALSVIGEELTSCANPLCAFEFVSGTVFANATVARRRSIQCTTPPVTGGSLAAGDTLDVPVAILCSGSEYAQEVPSALKYYGAPALEAVDPEAGSTSTEVIVTVRTASGVGRRVSGSSAKCQFGDAVASTVAAVVVQVASGSDDDLVWLSCTAPDAAIDGGVVLRGRVPVAVSLDGTVFATGAEFVYPDFCADTVVVLAADRGTIEDGSGSQYDYANSLSCAWLVEPSGLSDTSWLALDLVLLDTEAGADVLRVYDGPSASAPLLLEESGVRQASEVTLVGSAGTSLFVEFVTDGATTQGGFSLRYSVAEPAGGGSGSSTVVIAVVVVGGVLLLAIVLLVIVRRRTYVHAMGIKDRIWRIDYDELVFLHMLGAGAFGDVFKGTWRESDVAIKRLRDTLEGKTLRDFESEVGVMCELRHPHLLLFLGACTDPPNLCIVTEFMPRGSVYDLIHQEQLQLQTSMMYQWMSSAAKGLIHLHLAEPQILHRDFKSLNLLVDANWSVKISDFGLAKFKNTDEQDNFEGSVYWMSPEVLRGEEYTDKADVYSFGVVVWEMLTRKNPYEGQHAIAVALGVMQQGLRPEIPATFEPGVIQLCTAAWREQPKERPTMREVLSMLNNRDLQPNANTGLTAQTISTKSYSAQSGKMTDAPLGEVTLVFTDIENSTTLWQKYPGSMFESIKTHHELARVLMLEHEGYEVKSEGDAFMVAFATPAKAAMWGLAMQLRLMDCEWPEDVLEDPAAHEETGADGNMVFRGIRVRIGMHTGDVETILDPVTNRVDYYGPTVNTAARVCRQARGGQTLVTNHTLEGLEQLVRSNTIQHKSAGKYKVKGVDVEYELYYLLSSELRGRQDYQEPPQNRMDSFSPSAGGAGEAGVSFPPLSPGPVSPIASPGVTKKYNKSEDGRSNKRGSIRIKNLLGTENSWFVDVDDLEMGQRIGSGSYGAVFKARYQGREVAVKKFANSRPTEEARLSLESEVFIMMGMDHVNIVKLIGANDIPPNLMLVLEYMADGSLWQQHQKRPQGLGSVDRFGVLCDVAAGMTYLHRLNIMHRDLKSPNILLHQTADRLMAKLCDFGLARVKSQNQTMTSCGTVAWTAPEVLRRQRYDMRADVFSFGVIVWELVTGQHPYKGTDQILLASQVCQGRRPMFPSSTMPEWKRLAEHCWDEDAASRPAFTDIMNDLPSLRPRDVPASISIPVCPPPLPARSARASMVSAGMGGQGGGPGP